MRMRLRLGSSIRVIRIHVLVNMLLVRIRMSLCIYKCCARLQSGELGALGRS
jgi:hypothetical protein